MLYITRFLNSHRLPPKLSKPPSSDQKSSSATHYASGSSPDVGILPEALDSCFEIGICPDLLLAAIIAAGAAFFFVLYEAITMAGRRRKRQTSGKHNSFKHLLLSGTLEILFISCVRNCYCTNHALNTKYCLCVISSRPVTSSSILCLGPRKPIRPLFPLTRNKLPPCLVPGAAMEVLAWT